MVRDRSGWLAAAIGALAAAVVVLAVLALVHFAR
jgi:hypothetical protein